MAKTEITPEDYELYLRDLREKLKAYLERGAGSTKELRKQAELVLPLAEQFPDIFAKYADVEGMVAEVLARQQQEKFTAQPTSAEAPGCLLGWLLKRKDG